MRYVGVGRRFLAIVIDAFLVGIVTAPFAPIGHIVHRPGYYRLHISGGSVFWPSLLTIAYFFVMEAIVGATLGKLVAGIRVVKEDGSKLDPTSSFIRNIARIVDAFPYFLPYLVGAISVWSSHPLHQRLGDRWAHTVVVTHVSLLPRGSVTYPSSGVGGWQPTPPATPPAQAPPSGGAPPMPPPPPMPPQGA